MKKPRTSHTPVISSALVDDPDELLAQLRIEPDPRRATRLKNQLLGHLIELGRDWAERKFPNLGDESADAVQEAAKGFLGALNPSHTPPTSVRALFLWYLRNACCDLATHTGRSRLRKGKAFDKGLETELLHSPYVFAPTRVDEQIASQQLHARFCAVIETLKGPRRELATRFYLDEESIEALVDAEMIANGSVAKTPQNANNPAYQAARKTVRDRIDQSLMRLRKAIEKAMNLQREAYR